MQGTGSRSQNDRGFSLVEALVSLAVLAVGLLSLAGVLTTGLQDISVAPTDVIARQKVAEAIEAVYTARDTRILAWAQIRNVANGGIFLAGPQPLRTAGLDGLVNTTDDGPVEELVLPGRDGQLGTADDVKTPLTQYTREIRIADISVMLRQLTVTVTITLGGGVRRNYTVTTLISSFS
jgi:prepilin-type N-terminal cleavage/methylation domain-containing protein